MKGGTFKAAAWLYFKQTTMQCQRARLPLLPSSPIGSSLVFPILMLAGHRSLPLGARMDLCECFTEHRLAIQKLGHSAGAWETTKLLRHAKPRKTITARRKLLVLVA